MPARFSIPLCAMALIISSCAEEASYVEPASTTYEGECQSVFEGEICTWGTMQGENVTHFGATIPLAFVENAPLDDPMVFPPPTLARISLPAEITEATGIDHLGINWEAHGHPPGTFLIPHFDFHFNTIPGDDVEAIDCTDESKPDVIPAAYVLPDMDIPELGGILVGLCVPGMGMHSLKEEEMNATEPFGATMVIGYYSQDVLFVEPMVSRDLLLERQAFSLDVPAVDQMSSWPTSFEATYDEESMSYNFVFTM